MFIPVSAMFIVPAFRFEPGCLNKCCHDNQSVFLYDTPGGELFWIIDTKKTRLRSYILYYSRPLDYRSGNYSIVCLAAF